MRVEPSAYTVPIGQAVRLRYETSQVGFVQLLYVGSDRREISRVWPAEGQTRRLGATQGELPISLNVTAPAGENAILVVVSREPMNLAHILQGGAAAASPAVLQQLGCELIRQRNISVKEDAPATTGTCVNSPPATGAAPGAATGGVDGYTARILRLRGSQ